MPTPTPSDPPRPLVAMTMPHYGAIDPGAAAAFYGSPTLGAVRVVDRRAPSSSCLEHGFNIGLMHALAARDNGEAECLAMLHADLAPAVAGWVDVLYQRLVENRSAFVSAVSPIKEPTRRRSSTAIGDRADRWKVVRWIGLDERPGMPETFGPDEVCDPETEVLLLNTGCWIADLRHPFWDTYAFHVESRIDRVPAPGGGFAYTAEFRPEDWELSRDLQDAGLPIHGTWAVPLHHHGQASWSSHDPGAGTA